MHVRKRHHVQGCDSSSSNRFAGGAKRDLRSEGKPSLWWLRVGLGAAKALLEGSKNGSRRTAPSPSCAGLRLHNSSIGAALPPISRDQFRSGRSLDGAWNKGLGWPGSAILSSPPASGMQSRLADPGAVHSNNNHWMIVAQGVTPTIYNSCC